MKRRTTAGLIALVARRDYVRAVRRRGFVFATALLPISIVVLGAIGMLISSATISRGGGVPEMLVVHVVNESGLAPPPDAPAARYIRPVSRDDAQRLLEAGGAQEVYIVPADYVASGRVERLVTAERGPGLEDLSRQEFQEEQLGEYLRHGLLARQPVPADTATRLLDPVRIEERSIAGAEPRDELGVLLGLAVPYALSMMFVVSIFLTSGYLLQSVTEEKENRVVEILLSSVPAFPLMTGKILGLGAAGLTQVVVWLSTVLLALPVLGVLGALRLEPTTVLLAIAYFVLGYVAYGAIFAAIGSLAPGAREAQQYAGFFGLLAVIPLVGAGTFLSDPGSPFLAALALFPLTAPAAALQLVALTGEPPWPVIALSLGILATFTVVATVVSARVFRATLLLYGVRPSLRQIVRAVLARP